MRIDWLKLSLIIGYAAPLMLAITGMSRAAGVQSDAYPATAQWLSYPDYLERKLYVPGFTDPSCSAGVIPLGEDFYRIPQGVSEFKCHERSEA